MACYAQSVFEALADTARPTNNFAFLHLSATKSLLYDKHEHGSPNFIYMSIASYESRITTIQNIYFRDVFSDA